MAENETTKNDKTFSPDVWLKKYGIQKAWILRHIVAPWDKTVRVSPLTIAAFENNMLMVCEVSFCANFDHLFCHVFRSLVKMVNRSWMCKASN